MGFLLDFLNESLLLLESFYLIDVNFEGFKLFLIIFPNNETFLIFFNDCEKLSQWSQFL